MSLSVCLFVCPFICLSTRISRRTHGRTSPNFLCILPVIVIRLSSGGVAIYFRFVNDVIFHTMGPVVYHTHTSLKITQQTCMRVTRYFPNREKRRPNSLKYCIDSNQILVRIQIDMYTSWVAHHGQSVLSMIAFCRRVASAKAACSIQRLPLLIESCCCWPALAHVVSGH